MEQRVPNGSHLHMFKLKLLKLQQCLHLLRELRAAAKSHWLFVCVFVCLFVCLVVHGSGNAAELEKSLTSKQNKQNKQINKRNFKCSENIVSPQKCRTVRGGRWTVSGECRKTPETKQTNKQTNRVGETSAKSLWPNDAFIKAETVTLQRLQTNKQTNKQNKQTNKHGTYFCV